MVGAALLILGLGILGIFFIAFLDLERDRAFFLPFGSSFSSKFRGKEMPSLMMSSLSLSTSMLFFTPFAGSGGSSCVVGNGVGLKLLVESRREEEGVETVETVGDTLAPVNPTLISFLSIVSSAEGGADFLAKTGVSVTLKSMRKSSSMTDIVRFGNNEH